MPTFSPSGGGGGGGGAVDWLRDVLPYQVGWWSTTDSATAFARQGIMSITDSDAAGGQARGIDSDGRQFRQLTSPATINIEAGWRAAQVAFLGEWGGNPEMIQWVAIRQTTNIRAFMGAAGGTLDYLAGQGDDPAFGYLGFQYSTDLSDTNWMLITRPNTAGSAEARVDSGVAVVVDQVYGFLVRRTAAAEAVCEILDEDGTTLFTQTVTVGLPVVGDGWNPQGAVAPLTASSVQIRCYWGGGGVRGLMPVP